MTFRSLKRTRSSRRITPALLALGLLGLCLPAWAATPATFAAPVESSTGPGPRYVATADLNKDGIPDVAIVNILHRTLAIQLGSSTGMLATQRTVALPTSITLPVSVAGISDFNGDGNPDVAVVGNNVVATFYGDGAGGFLSTPPGLAQLPSEPAAFRGLAVANLVENTATPELITFSPTNQFVFIVTAPGTQFPTERPVLLSPNTRDVAMADVTGDGHVDIVGVNAAGVMAIQAGDGTGKFPSLENATAPNFAARLALGDATGDGLRDLVVAGNQYVSVTPSMGNNTYGSFIRSNTTVNAKDIALADFNLDGLLDVAVASATGPDVTVLINQGDGSFAQPTVLSTSSTASDIDVADWNGDGRPDIVVTQEPANTAVVFLNTTGIVADVAVRLVARPIFSLFNPSIRYDVSVTNNGPEPLDMATVTASLPAPLVASPGQCTPGTRSTTCGFGAIAPGATQSRFFTVPLNLFTLGLPYTVTARRTASTPLDPNAANDQASRRCIVVGPVLTSCN
ncbi:FG-GAP-like repeat-containing protein [Corallococcus terminator]|uniref:VCBS repeat-containing protein n=1 Tax=Corallococcus terminator TaxID=2316733 RepID=A0A3A8IHZ0_9BACT|nr:FG-GAP-like repeat-containing protein [Corallococcus terminator]RKG83052.1 VCBS repeat-containing protein [Corallococcus terminator]